MFFGFGLDPIFLKSFQKCLFSVQQDFSHDAIRWIRAENYHITLKFLGHCSLLQKKSFLEVFDKVPKFSIDLQAIGWSFFGERNPRAIALEFTSPKNSLQKLKNVLDQTLEEKIQNHSQHRLLRPHLTFARNLGSMEVSELANIHARLSKHPWPHQTFRVSDLYLYETHRNDEGVEYKIVGSKAL